MIEALIPDRVDMVGEDRFYEFEGKVYPSVTTILSATRDNSGLLRWREKVGEEEANRISEEALARGSKLHEFVENYLRDGVIPETIGEYEESWLKWWYKNPFEPAGIEFPVYSTLGYAGTVDCLAERGGLYTLDDWKSASKPKESRYIDEYRLQVSSYAIAVEERFDINIDHCRVVIAVPGQEAQEFRVNHKVYIDRFTARLNDYYWK